MAEAITQLIDVMQRELQVHQQLAVLLEGKIDAMRHYDLSRLESLGRSEQRLMDGLRLQEIRRREIVRLATHRLLPDNSEQIPTARELASLAPEPGRSHLLALIAMLKEVVERVQRLHRVHAVASRKLMTHFEHVFAVLAQSGRDSGLYGKAGRKEMTQHCRLVDATA